MWGACAGTTDVGVPGRERRMFGRACVLGMDSRLRGNDGCLGVPGRVGDGFPPARERRVFGRAGVLGMDSRLRGNDGCLGAAACWGWVPAFAGTTDGLGVHDGCGRAGAGMRGNDGGRSVGAGMAEVRAGRDAVTVTVIPAKAAIHPPPTIPLPTTCAILPVSRYSFPFSCQSEPTVFWCVLTATAAASRTLPPGPSTTVPEAIPEADERSASRRILGWVLGRGVRRAGGGAAKENPEPSP